MVNQHTMKTLFTLTTVQRTMENKKTVVEKIHEEFASFSKTMEELYMLKRVASDLRSYRKMIKLKKYD